MTLLVVDDLTVSFRGKPAVQSVSFAIEPGQRVGLIGESGSGKSVTALAIMGLLGDEATVTGSIQLEGFELVGRTDKELSELRGAQMGMVFQEPMTALDPTMRVGRQVAEVLRLHDRRDGTAEAHNSRARVLDMLGQVELPDPPRIADSFPHQLSGGQRQRVLMAMALINAPDLLIADEPTTALDVTVQAAVLKLLDRELDAAGAGLLFISHDLAVVSSVCTDALVMYHGRLVEAGPIDRLVNDPQHPYTRGLLATADLSGVAPGERLPVLSDFWDPTQEAK